MLSFALRTLEFFVSSNSIPNKSELQIVGKEFLRQNIRYLCTLSVDGQIVDLDSASLIDQCFDSSTSSMRSIDVELTWRNLKLKELPEPLYYFHISEQKLPSASSAIASRAYFNSYSRSAYEQFTLDDCLAAFFSREMLGAGEMWQCPCCAKPRVASKQLSLVRPPRCLIVHLKRFRTHGFYRSKLDDDVSFPMRLQLDSHLFVESAAQSCAEFDLYGVVNHR